MKRKKRSKKNSKKTGPQYLGEFRLHVAGRAHYDARGDAGSEATLHREPENPHDRNAIRVENKEGEKLGYVPRECARWLAKLLDAGEIELAATLGKEREWVGRDGRERGVSVPLRLAVYLTESGRRIIRPLRKPKTQRQLYHELIRTAFVKSGGLMVPADAEDVVFLLQGNIDVTDMRVPPESRLLLAVMEDRAESLAAAPELTASGRVKGAPREIRRDRAHFRGCLLGGAVGDALGAPVEFLSLEQIRERFGPDGIGDVAEAFGRIGAITDDTQMTLFTVEGLLRAFGRWRAKGVCDLPRTVWSAYRRWFATQEEPAEDHPLCEKPGWLVGVRELHACRAPGNTCLGALRGANPGDRHNALNESKGAGGIMRVAPVGLFMLNPGRAFEAGCDTAALTHGHRTGWLAAGTFAMILSQVIAGEGLRGAAYIARRRLKRTSYWNNECAEAIEKAFDVTGSGSPLTPETLRSLGEGWVAEEALAISLACALAAGDDFEKGVRLAVNHDGDSDTTGSLTGQLLGAMLGVKAIPKRWLARLELREVIETVADDLLLQHADGADWAERYPPA